MKAIYKSLLPLAGAALLAAPSLAAQVPGPVPAYFEAWVNPQTGNDATGKMNNPTLPFLTLGAAILTVSNQLLPTREGVVYALPGLYSDEVGTNGEVFPIVMKDRVHVQGAGAKECVVRRTVIGDFGGDGTVPCWLPTNPSGSGGSVSPIFNFGIVRDTVITSLEGFTLQGGEVQVLSYAEFAQKARVSNCVFDLREEGEDDLYPPLFGILIASEWDQNEFDEVGKYNPLDYHILNNTFIQGYQRSDDPLDVEVCATYNVAICNVNDPSSSAGFQDPDRSLRGVSELNVQNNLIRSLPGQTATALLGIDEFDTTVVIGTAPGPSNAFDTTKSQDVSDDAGQTWASAAVPDSKASVSINDGIGGPDPGFLGEMVSQTQSGLQNPFVRDWRLIPDSAVVDEGSGPDVNGTILRLGGTLVYQETINDLAQAFDWDGDGHGNPRLRGDEMDIGYDEVDDLAITGCYGNDSKSHGMSWHSTIRDGNKERTYVTPTAKAINLLSTTRDVTQGFGWKLSPGTQSGVVVGFIGALYLDISLGFTGINLGSTTGTTWVNPIDGVTHSFAQLILSSNDFGPAHYPFHLNSQALSPVSGGGNRLSNLQFEIY